MPLLTFFPISSRAHSKINLRLKVRGRRPDGFHILEMLNVCTSLADELEVSVAKSGAPWLQISVLECACSETKAQLEDVQNNLIGRAVQEMVHEFGVSIPSLSVKLTKRIPAGAGLGGGSADAAAMIRIMTSLLGASIGAPLFVAGPELESRLMRVAARVGSDVPYLLHGGAAYVGGVGEIVKQVDSAELDGMPALLIVPLFATSTAAVYARFRTIAPKLSENPAFKSDGLLLPTSYREILELIENDLEPAILDVSPKLAPVLTELRKISAIRAAITGSGSVIFALPENPRGFSDQTVDQIRFTAKQFEAQVVATKLIAQPRASFLTI